LIASTVTGVVVEPIPRMASLSRLAALPTATNTITWMTNAMTPRTSPAIAMPELVA
jgi:hypothetical protein